MPKSKPPALLFGNDRCSTFTNPKSFGDLVLPLWPYLQGCDARPHDVRFSGRSAALLLPEMTFLTTSFTSLCLDVDDNSRTSITFHLQGRTRVQIQDSELQLDGAQCLFVPAGSGPQEAYGHSTSTLMLQIDPHALHAAARAMRGLEREHPVDLEMQNTRPLTSASGPSLEALARHMGSTIDLHAGNPKILHQLGFQEFVYRQLVLLFKPDWLDTAQDIAHSISEARKRIAIDRICDAVQSEPTARFTLNRLAELGCMSIRGLQYAFQDRFGQSPMQWVREQRLAHARKKLLDASQESIAQIALDCGFATASSFSAFYRNRYGELPTATRLRVGCLCTPLQHSLLVNSR